MSLKPVIVCTEYKGVFFGWVEDGAYHGDVITLKNSRMCMYWSKDIKGVLGLASIGPSNDCKIGESVPEIELRKITAVISMTQNAVKKWELAPWSK